jgi:uncharacterized protein YfaT (DUF1175 family)
VAAAAAIKTSMVYLAVLVAVLVLVVLGLELVALERQDKVTTVAPAVDSLAETMSAVVAVALEVAESQELQTTVVTVASVSLRQSLEPHWLTEAVAVVEFIQQEALQAWAVLVSEVPAQLML